jgi:hypothetical protein
MASENRDVSYTSLPSIIMLLNITAEYPLHDVQAFRKLLSVTAVINVTGCKLIILN